MWPVYASTGLAVTALATALALGVGGAKRAALVSAIAVYKNMRRGIVALVFRCEVVSGTARTSSHDSREIAWLSPEQLETQMSDAYRVRLLDALRPEPAPIVRAHDGTSIIG
jgi:hypothetical protein